MELGDLSSFEGLTLGGIVASLVASFVWQFIWSGANSLLRRLLLSVEAVGIQSKLRRASFSFSFRYGMLGILSCLIAYLIWPHFVEWVSVGERGGFVVVFSLSALLLHAVLRDLTFTKVGVAKAESSVASGTDYEASLRLCQKSISFLGTGAYKLTNNAAFEPALARCFASGGSVRILMTRPDVSPLREAERRANVDPGDYSTKVRGTLKKLRAFKRDRAYPIEVRFHNRENATRMQEFRMMFVDDKYLFLSFNLYGHGDGSNIPQLILRPVAGKRSLCSFYRPFSESFERVWKTSAKWDFNEYLDD